MRPVKRGIIRNGRYLRDETSSEGEECGVYWGKKRGGRGGRGGRARGGVVWCCSGVWRMNQDGRRRVAFWRRALVCGLFTGADMNEQPAF